jgi:hypothetical protein
LAFAQGSIVILAENIILTMAIGALSLGYGREQGLGKARPKLIENALV